MRETTTIEEVKATYENHKSNAMKSLIKKMEELGQSKIYSDDFEKAKNTIECEICEREISRLIEEREICSRCLKAEKEEEKRVQKAIEMEKKWRNLLEELKAFEGDWKFELISPTETWDSLKIRYQRKGSDDYCTIYRDSYGGSRYSHYNNKHALRIETNNYNVKASGLTKDFGAKGLASGLHKKCIQLIGKIENKRNAKNAKIQREFDIEFKIKEDFPSVEKVDFDFTRSGPGGRYQQTGQRKFTIDGVHVSTYSAEEYGILGIGKALTVEQVKRVVEFVKTI